VHNFTNSLYSFSCLSGGVHNRQRDSFAGGYVGMLPADILRGSKRPAESSNPGGWGMYIENHEKSSEGFSRIRLYK